MCSPFIKIVLLFFPSHGDGILYHWSNLVQYLFSPCHIFLFFIFYCFSSPTRWSTVSKLISLGMTLIVAKTSFLQLCIILLNFNSLSPSLFCILSYFPPPPPLTRDGILYQSYLNDLNLFVAFLQVCILFVMYFLTFFFLLKNYIFMIFLLRS